MHTQRHIQSWRIRVGALRCDDAGYISLRSPPPFPLTLYVKYSTIEILVQTRGKNELISRLRVLES